MSVTERRKGMAAELEVVKLARQHGWPASRNLDQTRGSGPDIRGIPATCIEIKRRERTDIWGWWNQVTLDAADTELPVLAFRRNSSEWLAVVPLDELFALLRHRERA